MTEYGEIIAFSFRHDTMNEVGCLCLLHGGRVVAKRSTGYQRYDDSQSGGRQEHVSYSSERHTSRARSSQSGRTVTGNPHRKRRRFNIRKMLSFVLFLVFCVSLFLLTRLLIQYHESRNAYEQISALAVSTVEPTTASSLTETGREEPFAAETEEDTSTPAMISGALPWEKELRIADEVGITVDWDALEDINHYVVAWLYCPDTNINYPVVQYKDNEYFLNRNFNRRADDSGALFFDYRNILSEGKENWIIYGHRRNDKSMFGSLAKYAKEEYLAEHPVMYLLMPDRAYRAEIFACRTVHADNKYFQLWFDSSDEYKQYLNNTMEQSYWTSSVAVNTNGPILTLATCSTYSGANDPRLLVHAKLVPIT